MENHGGMISAGVTKATMVKQGVKLGDPLLYVQVWVHNLTLYAPTLTGTRFAFTSDA